MENNKLFFRRDPSDTEALVASNQDVPEDYEISLWHPNLGKALYPPRGARMTYIVWWLFHVFRVFSNSNYGICCIYRDNQLVHRSGIFPRFFRFPFMGAEDLQVGDTWTAEDERGKGLAKAALGYILHHYPQTTFWYLCDEENHASRKVVEHFGFRIFGRGYRSKKWGVALFGQYVLKEQDKASP